MRFMMIMYPGQDAESGILPDESRLTAMGKYNEELVKAGALLAAEGLQPTSKGARVTFSKGKATVTDGPFAETKEIIGGYWMIQCESRQEAIDWATRCPATDDEMIEIRQVYEADDFGPALSEELREAEERMRAQVAKR